MHSLLIFTEVKEVTIYSEEVLEIKRENELLKEEINTIKELKDEVDKIKEWFI